MGVIFVLSSCQTNPPPSNPVYYPLQGLALSSVNKNLNTCIFQNGFQILHFPMWHYPPEGKYTEDEYEYTVKSQFQLLHTILAYQRTNIPFAVFDESVTERDLDQAFLRVIQSNSSNHIVTRIDGTDVSYNFSYILAHQLFGGGIPQFYEQLNSQQKNLLFEIGASVTLFLLQQIPKVHRVIDPANFQLVTQNMRGYDDKYWVYSFREQRLRDQVFYFLRQNPATVVFIAYGANHNLYDDFATFSFTSGHYHCLNWTPFKDQIIENLNL